MPLYPLWPVLGLLALAYVFYTSAFDPDLGQPSLIANAAIIVVFARILRRRAPLQGGWTLRDPEEE